MERRSEKVGLFVLICVCQRATVEQRESDGICDYIWTMGE